MAHQHVKAGPLLLLPLLLAAYVQVAAAAATPQAETQQQQTSLEETPQAGSVSRTGSGAAGETPVHVRDKRLLADRPADQEPQAAHTRGFIAPATPMGFSTVKAQDKAAMLMTRSPRHKHHAKAIESFLVQTRKLGVPDGYALELLDKELSKANGRPRPLASPASPASSTQRPVYLASPLKPYGSLINFNQKPYEKHQLKSSKPIKEQQNDIPPPNKPLVVESDMKHLSGKLTEAVVGPSKPLPVSVPMQLDPLHLLQTAQAQMAPMRAMHEAGTHTLATIGHQHNYQLASVQEIAPDTHQAYASIGQEQLLQSMPHHTQDLVIPSQVHHQQILQSYPVELHQQQAIASHEPQPQQIQLPVPLEVAHQPEQHSVMAASPPAVQYVYPHAPLAQVHVETEPIVHQEETHKKHKNSLYGDQHEYAAQYRFGYRVKDDHSGNDFGHSEAREGKMTKGEYFVSLPDGRLQSVRYWSDPSGYHAHVTYSSHATHPMQHSQQHSQKHSQ